MTNYFEKEYSIKAHDVTINGDGVARLPALDGQSGKLVFCPNLLPGETARVRIVDERKSYARASVIEYLEKSNERKVVDCKAFGRCGGCALLHVSYEKQLEVKKTHIISCLSRIGKFAKSEIETLIQPVLGMENPYFYRNHVQYQVEESEKEFYLGFYEKQTNELIDHEACCLVPEICQKIRTSFSEFCMMNKIPGQNRKKKRNGIERLTVRMGFHTGDIMLVVESSDLPHFPAEKCAEFLQHCIEKSESLHAVAWTVRSIWRKSTHSHVEYSHLWGAQHIEECIGDKKYVVSPSSFFQINTQQILVLYEQIKTFVNDMGSSSVQKKNLIDLYCGTGTIGLHVSDKVSQILGVEVNEEAVADALKNAKQNDIQNCEYVVGRAENIDFHAFSADVIIIDPPRKGCEKRLLDSVLKYMAESIIYISCDPATLARDLRILADGDYTLMAIQPVDMFPWTGHVETVVLMSRKQG